MASDVIPSRSESAKIAIFSEESIARLILATAWYMPFIMKGEWRSLNPG